MTYKQRKKWALLILLIGMPAYVIVSVTIINMLDRPPVWLELVIYVGLGLLWALPCKRIFLGIGQADPDAPVEDEEQR